jgi:hypothetical protein
MRQKKWKNPFYTLLIPVGLALVVTTFAYSFMAFQAVNAGSEAADRYAEHPLFAWLRAHGSTALLVELAVLAVLTVGAIATDNWWTRDDSPDEDWRRPPDANETPNSASGKNVTAVPECELKPSST